MVTAAAVLCRLVSQKTSETVGTEGIKGNAFFFKKSYSVKKNTVEAWSRNQCPATVPTTPTRFGGLWGTCNYHSKMRNVRKTSSGTLSGGFGCSSFARRSRKGDDSRLLSFGLRWHKETGGASFSVGRNGQPQCSFNVTPLDSLLNASLPPTKGSWSTANCFKVDRELGNEPSAMAFFQQ